MEASYFYISLIFGLCISLLIEEMFGVSAGGMIVPGYLSMVCDDVSQLILILLISFVIYLVVNHVLVKFVILFGKRKFVATLIVGLIIKLLLEQFFPLLPFSVLEFRGIGVIVPGLIANTYSKQGIRYTVPTVLLASYLTFLLVTFIDFLF